MDKNENIRDINPDQMANLNFQDEKIEQEVANQIGMESDQVILGSPAADYGSTGKTELKNIIAASRRIAKDKYKKISRD